MCRSYARAGASPASGWRMRKQLPLPGLLITSTSAPCAVQIDLTIASPSPALLARARAVDTEEAFEHVRQRLGRNADAVIGDFENREALLAPHGEAYAAAARGVLDGVVEQIDDHLFEPRPVARHGHVRG
jgi:hypothetical protein